MLRANNTLNQLKSTLYCIYSLFIKYEIKVLNDVKYIIIHVEKHKVPISFEIQVWFRINTGQFDFNYSEGYKLGDL